MSKFLKEVKQVLERSSIKHVKILNMSNTFGYILKENVGGPAVVYVVSSDEPDMTNQMIDVQPDGIEHVEPQEQDTSPLNIVKQNAVMYLSQKGLIDCNSQQKLQELVSLPCMTTVEAFLRQHSLTDTEILNIIKPAIR